MNFLKNRIVLFFAITVIAVVSLCAQSPTDAGAKAEIRKVIETQAEAWNHGDIDGFMAGYDNSVDTTFVSGDSVTHGWQTVLDRYKKGYDSHEKMGVLTFSDLEIELVSPDIAVVDGHWKLARSSDNPHGRFTLVFKKTKAGWRIVHDHTTSLT